MTTGEPPQYLAARIQQRLAEDPRTAEQGVRAFIRDRQVFLRGAVPSAQRRDRVLAVVREVAPDHQVHDELELTGCAEPSGREELR
jgi:osmotically-inducible protein OsmY